MQPSLVSEFDSDAVGEQSRPGGFLDFISPICCECKSTEFSKQTRQVFLEGVNCNVMSIKLTDDNQPKGTRCDKKEMRLSIQNIYLQI